MLTRTKIDSRVKYIKINNIYFNFILNKNNKSIYF